MATHSSILAWKIPWTEESGVAKNQTQLTTHTPAIYHSTTDTHTHSNIYSHTHNHTYTPTHSSHTHLHTPKHSRKSMNACPYTFSHMHVHIHTHTHSHIHPHTSEHESSLVYNTLLLGLIKLSCHCILTTESGSTVNP